MILPEVMRSAHDRPHHPRRTVGGNALPDLGRRSIQAIEVGDARRTRRAVALGAGMARSGSGASQADGGLGGRHSFYVEGFTAMLKFRSAIAE